MYNKSKEDFNICIISQTKEIMFLSMKCQINITLLDNFFSFYLHHVFYNFKFEVTYNNYFDIQIRIHDNMDTNDNRFLFHSFCLPLYSLSVYYFIIFIIIKSLLNLRFKFFKTLHFYFYFRFLFDVNYYYR